MSVQPSWKYFENCHKAYFPFSCYVSHNMSEPWECPVPALFLWPSLILFFPLWSRQFNTLHGLFLITQARVLSAETVWPCRGWQEGRRFHTCCHCKGSVLSGFLAFSSGSHIKDNKMCVNLGLCKHRFIGSEICPRYNGLVLQWPNGPLQGTMHTLSHTCSHLLQGAV